MQLCSVAQYRHLCLWAIAVAQVQGVVDDVSKMRVRSRFAVSGKGDGAGKIEIEFFSNDELDRLVAKIK